ncbi:hypothetical protein MAP00_004148 [Monascus purpureus]|nr:hypothetical protein MAP00_004148 [Monascus purpureus]
MTRGEALSLLQDFVDRSYHLLLIIHESSTRSLVDQFYTRLSNGQRVNPSHASLILSISAISAYFWDESTTSHHGFASAAEAIQASLVWRTSALDILDGPRRGSYPCLEEIQARAILAYLVYSWEGCSARFRFLHSGSLVLAREMSLHLTDSPRSEQNDSPITKEIKRRLWWHLASTDWMLGFMGGPFDGTYTVQPRHMNVKYPRNLNDNDLNMCDSTFTYPINIPTQMSCFIQRIRLSEICRAIIDSRTPGLPDMEVIEYSQVLALDRLFEDTISELPPFLQLDGPIPPEAPRHLALQRSIIQLGLHSRRARLHRPFLLEETHDPRYQTSRVICLRSARIALSISTRILESSLGLHPASPGAPPSHRVGVVIGSMFVACTVLALSAGQSSNGGRTAPTIEETGLDIDVHAELANACRILAAIGEKSTLAAGLVRSLTGILRQYRVKGVDSVQTLHGSRDADTDAGPVHKENPEMSEGQKPSEAVSSDDAEPGLDQLWDEFMNTMPMIESWDQLLADLDSYFLA